MSFVRSHSDTDPPDTEITDIMLSCPCIGFTGTHEGEAVPVHVLHACGEVDTMVFAAVHLAGGHKHDRWTAVGLAEPLCGCR